MSHDSVMSQKEAVNNVSNFQTDIDCITENKYKYTCGHWSGKSQGNLIFLQGQGKVREFCKLVREILDTKKVREKSGNFISWAQNYLGCNSLSV